MYLDMVVRLLFGLFSLLSPISCALSAASDSNQQIKANETSLGSCEPTTTYLYAISAGLRIGATQQSGPLPTASTPELGDPMGLADTSELGSTIGRGNDFDPSSFDAIVGGILKRPDHILIIGITLAMHQSTDVEPLANTQNAAVDSSMREMERMAREQEFRDFEAYMLLTNEDGNLQMLRQKLVKSLDELDVWARETTAELYRGL